VSEENERIWGERGGGEITDTLHEERHEGGGGIDERRFSYQYDPFEDLQPHVVSPSAKIGQHQLLIAISNEVGQAETRAQRVETGHRLGDR
jgi:hypothetical protein